MRAIAVAALAAAAFPAATLADGDVIVPPELARKIGKSEIKMENHIEHTLEFVRPELITVAPHIAVQAGGKYRHLTASAEEAGHLTAISTFSVTPTLINNGDTVTISVTNSSGKGTWSAWVGAYSPFPPDDVTKVRGLGAGSMEAESAEKRRERG